MAKLRNASTDIGKFIQWVGRKCRNHNPLEELGLAVHARPSKTMYKAKTEGNVFIAQGEETTLYYMAGGRVFELRATEVNDEDLQDKELIAVGY
ncbi:hypothetical protein [Hyphomicrobium sp. ghe19]|uniref:hypothetical protein n=1 Tax=Hyphomicrobium sp. ghe19 TaxID=2682968 RepID=UPI001366B94F|nr:hypothetical protein HYPP_02401 [Hyphomicrobium sp. ghe19]